MKPLTQHSPATLDRFRDRAEEAGCTVAMVDHGFGWSDLFPIEWGTGSASQRALDLAGSDCEPVSIVPHDLIDGTDSVACVGAVLGVAETGSVLIVHDDLSEVWLAGLSELLVVVVAAGSVVDTLADAINLLDELGQANESWTLLTGPSRTADIERVVAIGMQGCLEMHVAVLP